MKQLEKLSIQEIDSLLEKLSRARESALDRAKLEIRSKIEDILEKANLKLGQIFGRNAPRSSTKKTQIAAKYQNPENLTQTWTGRGRQPTWLKEKLAKGTQIETFLMPKKKATE
jgi:DNA-binding protein H-NS